MPDIRREVRETTSRRTWTLFPTTKEYSCFCDRRTVSVRGRPVAGGSANGKRLHIFLLLTWLSPGPLGSLLLIPSMNLFRLDPRLFL